MEFGIFDSFDRGRTSQGEVLKARSRFAVEAERLGIGHYHVTEHHGAALSVCPSPKLGLRAITERVAPP